MVRVGAPVDAGSLQPQVDALLKRGKVGGRDVIIERPYVDPQPYQDKYGDWIYPTPRWELGVEARQLAYSAYYSLSFWKRARWTICAYRHGVPANAPAGVAGWSGLSLYLRCFFAQNIIPPAQPISPCARRVTDATASPWDYTP